MPTNDPSEALEPSSRALIERGDDSGLRLQPRATARQAARRRARRTSRRSTTRSGRSTDARSSTTGSTTPRFLSAGARCAARRWSMTGSSTGGSSSWAARARSSGGPDPLRSRNGQHLESDQRGVRPRSAHGLASRAGPLRAHALGELAGRVVVLERRGDVLAEVDGAGRWDAAVGRARGGDASPPLRPVAGFTMFPRDFEVHFPAGKIWARES